MSALLPVVDAEEMRAVDDRAMEEFGMPGIVLMERAGLAAAHELVSRHPEAERVAIVCGAGNNGGDGFVVARHVADAGMEVVVLLVGPLRQLSLDARTNFDLADKLGIAILRSPEAATLRRELRRADVVVDAVFGTGFSGAPRGAAAAVIEAINRAGRPVMALDVPSGLNASDGTVLAECVRATLTVSFHAPKLGLLVSPGSRYAGRVVVADIGIAPAMTQPTRASLVTAEALELVPRRDAASTKYSAGSVLVLGGSTGMLGAPALSGMAALRAGAGIVWLAVQPEHADRIPGLRPELMVRELPAALELTGQAGAIVIGPGLGRSVGALEMSRKLSRRHAGPVVVDADGLFALNGQLEQLARRRLPAVLTPHEGELARLLERESAWVRANRVAAVREAAARSRAVVLLKGADTLVAGPDGERLLVSVSDAHGLATAGAGDVLSGVIGALLARGLDPLTAAALGACAHGRAGRAAMECHGGDGILAGDVIEALPGVLAGH